MTIKANEKEKGRGLWKLNNSFLHEENYVKKIKYLINNIKNDDNINLDEVALWEYQKYKSEAAL
jgi:hypothetical protein